MAIAPNDLRQMPEARFNEDYIVQERYIRQEQMMDQKQDLETIDAIVRGDWPSARGAFGSSSTYTKAEQTDSKLKIQNFIKTARDDIKRVAASARASIRCDTLGRSEKAADKARMLEAIGAGYWVWEPAIDLEPQLCLDLIESGGCFVLSYPKRGGMYPSHRRLNPRGCFPTLDSDAAGDEALSDLLYVQKMLKRKVHARWPQLGLDTLATDSDTVEVIEFYTPDQWEICVYAKEAKTGRVTTYEDRAWIVEVQNSYGIMPVAYSKLPTGDRWDGVLLQAAGMMDYQNRLRTLMIDNAEEATYSASESLGKIGGTYGPGGEIELDPGVQGARYQKIPPAPIQGGLFALDNALEQDIRGMLAHPAAREGQVSQSIASGSFIEATQGQFSSLVREVQDRGIAPLRRRQTMIDYKLDRTFFTGDPFPKRKPLILQSGDATDYDPLKDIPDPDEKPFRVTVLFGLLTGTDTLNRTTQLLQLAGGRVISREQVRANLDSLGENDWRNEEQKIAREMAMDAFLQSRLANPQFPSESFLAYLDEGMTPEKAAAQVAADLQAAAQAQMAAQQAQSQVTTGQPIAGLPEAGGQAASLAAGGVPGAPSGENQAGQPGGIAGAPALPPLSTILNQPLTQIRAG